MIDYNTYALALDQSWSLEDGILEPTVRHTDWSFESAALWPSQDGTSFSSYGGHVSYATQLYGWPSLANKMLQFTPNATDGTWDPVAPPPESDFYQLRRTTEGLYASGDGVEFAFGGQQTRQTDYGQEDYRDVPGMVIYNETSKEWRNLSSTGCSSTGTATSGAAHFVPIFGPAGLAFVFGGTANGQPAPFDYVFMFEPASQQWRKQQVTGDASPAVRKPCVVGLQGDHGTYEVRSLETEFGLIALTRACADILTWRLDLR